MESCDSFFEQFLQESPTFPSKTHIFKFHPLFYVKTIFPSAIHFLKCDLFFQAWSIPRVTHFCSCDRFSQLIKAHFSKCEPFF